MDLLTARLATVRVERSNADEALRVAQQHAEDLAAQQTQLEKRQRALKESVRTARASYLQQVLNTCPEDVLRCIFEAVADLPDDQWEKFGFGEYNAERAAAPFTLASLCARWRRVALACPRLWTYVGFPDPTCADAHLSRVETVLARSSPCDIDILTGIAWTLDVIESCTPFDTFIDMISKHSHRWRRLELWLPNSVVGAPLFTALRGQLPRVVRLSVTAEGEFSFPSVAVERGEGYLPYAPRLRSLEISARGFDVADFYHPGLPSLRILRTWVTCTASNSSRLLSLTQDSLTHIDVSSDVDIAPIPLRLPNVVSMCVRQKAFLTAWPGSGTMFPHIRKLSLDADSEVVHRASFAQFLAGIAPTIVHLELFGALRTPIIDAVQNAVSITHLALAEPGTNDQCELCDDIFAYIADAEPCVWPKLTSVRVAAETTLRDGTIEGVLHLVNKRNVRPRAARGATDESAPERPARITEVVIEGKPQLAWLRTEIGRLLNSGCDTTAG